MKIPLRRKKTDLSTGINNTLGLEHDCAVRDLEKKFHTHQDDLAALDQCTYELTLLESVLLPAFDKIMTGISRSNNTDILIR